MKSVVVGDKLIDELSNLARVGVGAHIAAQLVADVGEVLGYVDRIQKVSTKEFIPRVQKAPCRKDNETHAAWFKPNIVRANIPHQKDGAIHVEETFVTGNVTE